MHLKIILIVLSLITLSTQTVYAAVCVNNQTGVSAPAPASGQCGAGSTLVATGKDLETIFGSIVSVAGLLLGFVFFFMLVAGGVRFLLSGGDPKALQAAKGTMTWAIIGLALFTLSFTILLIIQAFTGVNVTIFRIGN